MNLQVIAAPDVALLWVSGSLRGSVHDLTAARIWGAIRALATTGMLVLADKAYQGAGAHILTPYQETLQARAAKDAHHAHAKLHGPGERANAQLKSWRILRKLRCCPHHAAASPKPSIPCNSTRSQHGKKGSMSIRRSRSRIGFCSPIFSSM
ncbi:transposase family protein [Actinomadura chokoriensis]|uniref:transposase family protein n=1 Tax=Actinomadura chokoriensis TaxID=454156 RepID=UPI003563A259